MKISRNWLETYLDLSGLSDIQLGEILTEIGLEVEGVDKVESIKGGLEGIVIGQVLTCQKHPNADRLSLTTVDIGDDALLQIVCGAPNVAVGQKVCVATIGTTLYDAEGNPFTIRKGKIRGEISQGMICAEDELGLGDDHSGILVLHDEVSIGTAAKDHFSITTDTVFEIGLTPNRSDATCHLGVAQDLRATLVVNFARTSEVNWPEVSLPPVAATPLPVQVRVENSEACPRYAGISLRGVKVGPSPQWLRDRLTSVGVRPINNIVDITNFVLHEMGQPLHAFDLDQIKNHQIIVKTLPSQSTFISLDGQERKLSEHDLMICDGQSHGMCIAGVFGGLGSGVTEQTRDIFLESAHFNAKWIRRTSERHLLFTDAARVFEKGSDPNICVKALSRAAALMVELAGAEVASQIVDVYPVPIKPIEIDLSYANLHRLIGVEIPANKVMEILIAMKIEIVHHSAEGLRAAIPTNKADVTREADLIEEILRIYGFNNVPLPDDMHLRFSSEEGIDETAVQNRASDFLASHGFLEMMALSMLDKKYFDGDDTVIRINNTSNINMEVMRPSLLPGIMEVVRHNLNRQQKALRLFEFGHIYQLTDDHQIQEHHRMAMVISGWSQEHWLSNPLSHEQEYFAINSLVDGVLTLLGIKKFQSLPTEYEALSYGRQYRVKGETIVNFGKIKQEIAHNFDVKQDVHYAVFQWDRILELLEVDDVKLQEISKYPTVKRDLALVLPEAVQYADLAKSIRQAGQPLVQDLDLFDIYRDESLGQKKKSYAVSITFGSNEKTLNDKDIDQMVDKILQRLLKGHQATLR